ncbi:MAG: IS1634 family transposase [Pseudomonadales bacterium]
MSSPTDGVEQLRRKRIGVIPLLQQVAHRLRFDELLAAYIPAHGNEKIAAAQSLLLLVFNITCGRQPLYELPQWTTKYDGRLFGWDTQLSPSLFNDDRFARALDKLYQADRASLMTDLVVSMVQALQLDLSQIHNDSTSIKSCGHMPGQTRSGLRFAHGHSKDHRPDLKQIVFSLTLSADGAVPIHCKSYAGNRTDDTTHIDTWKRIRHIAGVADFLYVADCKVCTDKQLSFITRHGGRVVTLMPDTWGEAKAFKQALRTTKKIKKRILRQPIPNSHNEFETFYCFTGRHVSVKAGHTLYWIYTTEKRKRDRQAREQRLLGAEQALGELMAKLNTRQLKTQQQIRDRVEQLLKHHRVTAFYRFKVLPVSETRTRQLGKGRPGKDTRYRRHVSTVFSLAWSRNTQALEQERKTDGVFPILCTDPSLSAKQALLAYKYQPRLEKRFEQLKTVHHGAPTLFKKVERVEAMMFLFFMALIMQAVIEREVRQSMNEHAIDAIPIYPEHRLAQHPTTAKIFDRFHDISLYRLYKGSKLIKQYQDELTSVQVSVLTLLGMTTDSYWKDVT